ncbi:MAG TPA: tetratricopeptide repeat protein, partial [Nitrososphaeraceae archaeon]
YDEVIYRNSEYITAYYGKGYSLDCLQRYEEAIKCYDQVIRINPDYVDAYYGKGKALEKLGMNSEATKYLTIAKKLKTI